MRSALVAITLVLAGPALGQTPNKKAEALNEEGKEFYSDKKDFEGAAAKFRQAIAISPDARYYFNLCSALDRLALYEQALEACDGVLARNPKPELAEKTSSKAADIRARMHQAEIEPLKPPEPEQPATDGSKPPVATAPVNPYRAVPPGEQTAVTRDAVSYGWGLGVAIGGVRNNYDSGEYERAGFDLKIHVDLQVVPKLHMGIQPYVQLASFKGVSGELPAGRSGLLSIVDIGVGWFWHIRLGRSNFSLTPLAGVSLSFMNPDSFDVSYMTAGFRFEAGLNWVIANRHVLSIIPAFTIYPPTTQIAGRQLGPGIFGLDATGSTFAVLVGYTYRFDRAWFLGLPLE